MAVVLMPDAVMRSPLVAGSPPEEHGLGSEKERNGSKAQPGAHSPRSAPRGTRVCPLRPARSNAPSHSSCFSF